MKRSAVWLSLGLLVCSAQVWAQIARGARRPSRRSHRAAARSSAATAPRTGSTDAVIASTTGWIAPPIAPSGAVTTSRPNGSMRAATASTAASIGAARRSIARSTAAVGRSTGAWIGAVPVAADQVKDGAGSNGRRRRFEAHARQPHARQL